MMTRPRLLLPFATLILCAPVWQLAGSPASARNKARHAAAAPALPPTLFSDSGPAAARLLERAVSRLHPALWQSGTSLPSSPVAGTGEGQYEITAKVEGRVSCDGQDMLMLRMNGASVDALIPHDFSPTWMDSGAQLRLIVRDNIATTNDTPVPAAPPAPPSPTTSTVSTAASTTPATVLTAQEIAAGSPDSASGSAPASAAPVEAGGLRASAGYVVVAVAPEVEVAMLERGREAVAPRARAAMTSRYGYSARRQVRGSYGARETQAARWTSAPALPAGASMGHPICALTPTAAAIYPYYRAEIQRINPRLDSLTLDKITSSILAYSTYYTVDPRLIMAMILAESHFDPNAVSRDGAVGIGQLMPGTAAGLGVDPRDPVQNVGAAVKILSDHVAQYGGTDSSGLVPMNTLLLTMAAYNAGGGAVRKYHGIPPYRETQAYVRRVAAYYRAMCGN